MTKASSKASAWAKSSRQPGFNEGAGSGAAGGGSSAGGPPKLTREDRADLLQFQQYVRERLLSRTDKLEQLQKKHGHRPLTFSSKTYSNINAGSMSDAL